MVLTVEEEIGPRCGGQIDRLRSNFLCAKVRLQLQERTLQIHCAQNSSLEAKAAPAESFCVAREGISPRSGETKRLYV